MNMNLSELTSRLEGLVQKEMLLLDRRDPDERTSAARNILAVQLALQIIDDTATNLLLGQQPADDEFFPFETTPPHETQSSRADYRAKMRAALISKGVDPERYIPNELTKPEIPPSLKLRKLKSGEIARPGDVFPNHGNTFSTVNYGGWIVNSDVYRIEPTSASQVPSTSEPAPIRPSDFF